MNVNFSIEQLREIRDLYEQQRSMITEMLIDEPDKQTKDKLRDSSVELTKMIQKIDDHINKVYVVVGYLCTGNTWFDIIERLLSSDQIDTLFEQAVESNRDPQTSLLTYYLELGQEAEVDTRTF